jgi:hypothetical protein
MAIASCISDRADEAHVVIASITDALSNLSSFENVSFTQKIMLLCCC